MADSTDGGLGIDFPDLPAAPRPVSETDIASYSLLQHTRKCNCER